MTSMQETGMTSHWLRRVWALAMLFVAVAPAAAQNAIQSINSTQQAGTEVVRIELSQPLTAVPNGFSVQTPPRVAIDLPGVSNALGKSMVEVNQGNLRSINVAQSGDRTRLVLNLKQPANYQAQLQGKVLLLVLAPTAAGSPEAAATTGEPVHFAQSLNTSPVALRDIDFRRGQDGAGRVVVDLPNNQVGVDIRQQGQSLVVEFLRSTLPDSLRRRLDVTDFGTPVHTITATQSGDRVRLVVEPRGVWEHSAYQSDNQFVLEVRTQKIDPNKLTQGPGYSGEKLSLNFQNIEVRALLQVIADFTNFNVVTSDTVTGNVTLRLKDVPWDQALDIILQAKGLGLRKSGNVIWIAPKDELAAKEKLDLESKQQIAALEPVRTQSFQLNYTKAEEVAKGLTGQSSGQSGGTASRILSARGSVIYETRTNQLFVSDIPSKLEEVQAMITKIDIPVRQVLIEARIVIADDKFGRSLGVRLGAADLRGIRGGTPGYSIGGDNRVTVGGNMNAIGAQTRQTTATDVPFNDTQFINLPANGQNNYDAATFALSLFGASSNRFLNLEISALEADGKGKVVSSPRVITADQVKALIEQGEELPYQIATSSGATALQFRKANLRLEVTPQITPEGNVILDVDVNKDSVGRSTAAGFAIDTKHVKTQVLVENGGTVVIGGIFEQSDREDITKVPFLGDVPYLGNLFKTKSKSSNKTELLIFITPKVVSDRTAAR
ncbi:Type IV pilus biogenesis and competence protein PilQ [Burkholderiaceae bacterium]|nr:Type IV pilus biogenesis and competence protein PilQ [Burkholderiaceae bacterium]